MADEKLEEEKVFGSQLRELANAEQLRLKQEAERWETTRRIELEREARREAEQIIPTIRPLAEQAARRGKKSVALKWIKTTIDKISYRGMVHGYLRPHIESLGLGILTTTSTCDKDMDSTNVQPAEPEGHELICVRW